VQAIGMISLETVALELELANLFSRMLSIPISIARAIYMTPKSDQVRLEVLRNAAHAALDPNPEPKAAQAAFEKKKAAALKQVIDITKHAQEAINERHRVVHDSWGVSAKTGEIVRITVDGRTRAPKAIDLKELQRQVNNLRLLIDEVIDAASHFDHNPPTLVSMQLDEP
jgi:hypothetical protein